MQKRYYILIIMATIAIAAIIREFDTASFEIIKHSTAYAPENDEPAAVAEYAKININTADSRLLDTLDGIGEVTAERIINYRTKYGNFEVIQDIMKVEGIGEKTFEEIKSEITVE